MNDSTTEAQRRASAPTRLCRRHGDATVFAYTSRDGEPLCELHAYEWEMAGLHADRAREALEAAG